MTTEERQYNLVEYGYNSHIGSVWNEKNRDGCLLARVMAEYRHEYKLMTSEGECLAKIAGKRIFDAINRNSFPTVGDWVVITNYHSEKATISEILPRTTILEKKNASMQERYGGKQEAQIMATNVDTVFIIESTDRDYSLNRFERYLVQIQNGGIKPAIILNKVDLVSELELKEMVEHIKKRFKEVDIITTSVVTKAGSL